MRLTTPDRGSSLSPRPLTRERRYSTPEVPIQEEVDHTIHHLIDRDVPTRAIPVVDPVQHPEEGEDCQTCRYRVPTRTRLGGPQLLEDTRAEICITPLPLIYPPAVLALEGCGLVLECLHLLLITD